jgi:hypothetical protein
LRPKERRRGKGPPEPVFPVPGGPGLAAPGPEFLPHPDLGRLKPIVAHGGSIRAVTLTSLS